MIPQTLLDYFNVSDEPHGTYTKLTGYRYTIIMKLYIDDHNPTCSFKSKRSGKKISNIEINDRTHDFLERLEYEDYQMHNFIHNIDGIFISTDLLSSKKFILTISVMKFALSTEMEIKYKSLSGVFPFGFASSILARIKNIDVKTVILVKGKKYEILGVTRLPQKIYYRIEIISAKMIMEIKDIEKVGNIVIDYIVNGNLPTVINP
jgi:hypothetical protein